MFLGGTTSTKVPPLLGGTILTWSALDKFKPGGTQQTSCTIEQSIPLHVGQEGTIGLADAGPPGLEPADEWRC